NNSKHKAYPYYGARGIKLYDAWNGDDPAPFISYIEDNLGPKPKGKSLDRINNEGNYEPGNLRWATPLEQNLNARPAIAVRERAKQYILDLTELKVWSKPSWTCTCT